MNVSEALIREIVTKVLEESAGKGSKPEFEKHIDPSGIIGIKTSTVKCEPFQQDGVKLKDVVTLEIEIDGRVVSGGPGDIIYIPKGSHIHFQTPNRTRYAYFVYPADWQ